MYKILVLPQNISMDALDGENLHEVLLKHGLAPDAPCGGNGKCGKCTVLIDGVPKLSCRTRIQGDLTVTLPCRDNIRAEEKGIAASVPFDPVQPGYQVVFDIGTTTLVCYLLDAGDGREMVSRSAENPQRVWGADVVSRIQAALHGKMELLTNSVRSAMRSLLEQCCREAKVGPGEIGVICVVGNPAMRQLFLGISPENLVRIPFSPVLTEARAVACDGLFPEYAGAELLILPDIGGYVGADTVAGILATGMHKSRELTLLVDIGTNGEMVLGNRDGLVSCATAAGPALEGAEISCGMGARNGAIDHVWLEEGQPRYSVIGGGRPIGLCGSGLIDAAAVHLSLGNLDARGKIQGTSLPVAESIALTQEDIRRLQLAKGAICGGIQMLCSKMGVSYEEIDRVYLAGGFGTYLNPDNACRIGLLPMELRDKIKPVGNAAGSGGKMLARCAGMLKEAERIAAETELLELSEQKAFPKLFARAMRFPMLDIKGESL